jgi:hexosaminidase
MVTLNSKNQLVIPNCIIKDYPRFPYRGMHLDVCRHFFPISFVKKYIDYLATYKFNKFHWHLTEDQGWRIEIKKYPALTTIGANRNGTLIGRYPGKGNDNKPYGGFYTQSEIKEVIEYAKERYIEVIPEIEMPGHSSAAIASYPWLSCFPQKPTEMPSTMKSQKSIDEQKAGRIKLVQETWGVFDDVFCAGKDSTFTFLENVLDEVSALFPSKYIHIGGDESPKTHWKICPACQKRIKDLNLKDEHELQSYFIQRIEKYLNKKGKTIIGWDEILEGGLAPNAVVMSWRGEKGGIEAARQKHQVIMTPGNPLYFDHTQSKNEDSVTFGGYNPIENVYAYEPASKELSAEESKYILGAQANMWTEYQNNTRKIEYQLFPRITALSEVLWSPKEKRDWKDFERRLPVIFERLDKQKINYSKAYYEPKIAITQTEDFNGVQVTVKSKQAKSKYYFGSKVQGWFSMYYDSIYATIKKTGIYGIRMLGKFDRRLKEEKWGLATLSPFETLFTADLNFSFNKATGKKITLTTQADKKYPGDGAFTLVNGVQNEKGMLKSSEFLGFNGTDMEATIDLGKDMEVSKIVLHTLNQQGSWIYLPSQVEVSFIPFIDTTIITKHAPIESVTHIVKDESNTQTIQLTEPKTCRYVRVYAKNFGIIPTGKPGAGNSAWLFVDEIEVQ